MRRAVACGACSWAHTLEPGPGPEPDGSGPGACTTTSDPVSAEPAGSRELAAGPHLFGHNPRGNVRPMDRVQERGVFNLHGDRRKSACGVGAAPTLLLPASSNGDLPGVVARERGVG